MKKTVYLFAAVLLLAVVVQAQQTPEKPFAVVEQAVKDENGGWGGNKERLSTVFDSERQRLGTQFESELLKWLGNDPEKHYWISGFLDWKEYLHRSKRLPELSLLIKEQGLTLVRGKDDDASIGYVIGLSVTAAILSDELGLRALALSYKSEAEALLQRDPSLSRHFPAVSEAERRRYEAIQLPARPSTNVARTRIVPVVIPSVPDANPPKQVTAGGPLNTRAIKLVKPAYPRAARQARISGTVEVHLTFDETGKVISAKAISGPPELWKVSEEAALESLFKPVTLSGQPVKVTGSLIYNFVAR